ncbi:MAG: iron-sulfur cluster assembly protein [Candidatus Bathyarchaeia archaeon]
MDKGELIEVLSRVYDPEYPVSVIDLKIVDEEDISFEDGKIKILFTPTSPFCPMGGMIGALIKYAVEKKTRREVDVSLKPGTHTQEKMLNEMLSDRKKYEGVLERLRASGIIDRCVSI